MNQAPFPAIDPNELGNLKGVTVDALLLPYLLGLVETLTDPNNFYGDAEDVQGTVYAFQHLAATIADIEP